MKKYEQFYINGEWVNPVNTLNSLDVINPATEESIGTIAMGDTDDVNSAVEAAKKHLPLSVRLQLKREWLYCKRLSKFI